MTPVLAQFGVGQVLWSLLWLSLFVLYMVLVISIVADIFGSDDLSGLAKALWTLAALVVPFFGALLYVILRGDTMTTRFESFVDDNERALGAYIQEAANCADTATDLEMLAALHQSGLLNDHEFSQAKAKLLDTP